MDINERRKYDNRFYLLTNIQYDIALYQAILVDNLVMYQDKLKQNNDESKMEKFFLAIKSCENVVQELIKLREEISLYSEQELKAIYKDLSIRIKKHLDI